MRGEALVKTIRSVARWYLRQRRIVRVFVFILLFIAPSMLYAYRMMPSKTELIKEYGTPHFNRTASGIDLPETNLQSIIGGRTVFYIGDFEYSKLYQFNSTTYIYEYNKEYGLLIALSNNDNPVFVLTSKYNTTMKVGNQTIKITRITLVLPPEPPDNIPNDVKSIVCSHVGNYTRYYDAFIHGTLPESYSNACWDDS